MDLNGFVSCSRQGHPAVKFPPVERKLLLNTPRIGPSVVARLEAMGIGSLSELRRRGVDNVVQAICAAAGNGAWANRRSALLQAAHLADRPVRTGAAHFTGMGVPRSTATAVTLFCGEPSIRRLE